jgi:hypothetical protein
VLNLNDTDVLSFVPINKMDFAKKAHGFGRFDHGAPSIFPGTELGAFIGFWFSLQVVRLCLSDLINAVCGRRFK